MMKLQILIFYLLLFSVNVSCQDEKSGNDRSDFERQKGDPVDGLRIAWDYSSMQKLSPRGERTLPWTGYPRVRRLQNGSLLAVYEAEGNVELIRSDDNGSTWSAPELLFEKHQASSSDGASAVVYKANGELIQLANGDVVAACNYRPQQNGIAPFSIAVKRSHDSGKTWSDAEVIYEAGKDFRNGCWEPAFLQLPSGELHVYFANENPYRDSDEQEISMLASEDNGLTWSDDHITVSFREDRRDGMPVPLLVGDEVLVSIEDNGHGQFKPWIVRNPVDDLWSSPVRGNSPLREYALEKNLSPDVYAGAPYLMKVPSGEVILSYQTNEDRSPNWELSTMEVAIGDTTGRNFSKYTHPFDVPLDREAKWNSISLWDENTVVAASTTSFRSQACEVWIKKGHIIPELRAVEKEIDVDGKFATGEWSNELPVFIGRKGPVNMRADIARDSENVYFSAEVNYTDASNFDEANERDGVTFFVDAGEYNLIAPDTGVYSIFCNKDGQIEGRKGKGGKWIDMELSDVKAITRKLESADGYRVELQLSLDAIEYKEGKDLRINFKLGYQAGDKYVEENIIHADENASRTWCRTSLK